ncbi:MAG: nucleotidyltransferase family protein, partial [Myxococcota bacterium]|nr:nucleotidyltransferase family protein [Myxococcota bacterium]
MIVLPAQAPPARRWLAHLARAAAGVIRAGDRFDDVFAFESGPVAALARREGVAPLVHCGLVSGRIADPVPSDFRALVRDAWETSRRRSRTVLETGAAAQAELAAASVDAVAVGAFALVRGKDDLYREPGLRPVERLDLVVPGSDLVRAAARLRGLGFAPVAPSAARPHGGGLRLVRRVAGLPVLLELHTGVGAGRGRRLEGDRFLAAHTLRAADGSADAAVSGQLLFVAARLAGRRGLPWIDLLDLHRLVEARPDWRALLREAGAPGLRRALYVGLAASRELLRSPIPKEVLAELAPGPRRRRLLHWRLAVDARAAAPGDG